MPSVLTHYGFNKEVFDNNIKFLKGNEDIYLVGAQGPDPFFFYGILPLLKSKNGKEIRKYGTRLHKMDPFEVFYFFFNYANGSENKDVLYAYILGAGLHYILDRKIHPYVFYNTGFSDDKKKKKEYFAKHTLFETNIDVLLMEGRYKEYKVRSYDAIQCDKDKIGKVSKMYDVLSKKIIKENIEGAFEESYKQMIKVEEALYSRKGVKKWFANVFFKSTPFNTMMHPLKVNDDIIIDYLNYKKREWRDPSSEIVCNKSIDELFEDSKEDACDFIMIVKEAYRGNVLINEVSNFTKGVTYDGYHHKDKMKVFDDIYRKENS